HRTLLSSSLYTTSPLPPRALLSFPTRRSSDPAAPDDVDVGDREAARIARARIQQLAVERLEVRRFDRAGAEATYLETFYGQLLKDRKSTRLNSSHGSISYAAFCLKKINYQEST